MVKKSEVSALTDPCAWFGPGFSPAGEGAFVLEGLREIARLSLPVAPGGDPGGILALADEARTKLGADERLVLLYGYDVSCAAAGLAHHESGGSLGPDAWLGVGRARPAALPPGPDRAVRPLALTFAPGAGAAHEAAVRRCLAAIVDGVCYQANLAHPLTVEPRDAEDARAWLRGQLRSPSPPFAALLPLPGFGDLVSLSPERFLVFDLESRVARAFPVKGTAPRGATPADDAAQARALEGSEKDRAEHVMIVDLLRNDLARTSDRVTVEELAALLPVSNVFHLESTIRGDLTPGTDLRALLSVTAPGGSITGAPKSSACDVIAALEGRPRGPYTGTLVVVDAEGRGASSILIRTWIRPDDRPGWLHVGGGVVADSSPAAEWEETLAKARAFGEPRGAS